MEKSLNPCFNGKCSQRVVTITTPKLLKRVLILVLMENALRAYVGAGCYNEMSHVS